MRTIQNLFRLLGALMLIAGLFVSSPANAQSNQPQPTTSEEGEGATAATSNGNMSFNTSSTKAGIAAASAVVRSFNWQAPVYYRESDGLARPHLILTDKVGIQAGDIITGTVGTLPVEMKLNNKKEQEKKFGEIPMAPGSTIVWRLFFNGQPWPEFSQVVNPSPVIITPNWPDAPLYCRPAAPIHNDPGILAKVDGMVKDHSWHNETDFTLGPWLVDVTRLHHVFEVFAAHDIDHNTGEWKFNSYMKVEWDADCGIPHNPPTKESASCISLTPNHVALKPGETALFTLTGSKVLTYSIELDGQPVSSTDTYSFVADAVGQHTLTGKVAGQDGVFNTAPACSATVVITQTPPPPVPGQNVLTASGICAPQGTQSDILSFTGKLLDDKGQPLVEEQVTVATPDGKTFDVRTGADGTFNGLVYDARRFIGKNIVFTGASTSFTLPVTTGMFAGCTVSKNPPTNPPTERLRIEATSGLVCLNYEPVALFAYIGTWGAEASNAVLTINNDPSTTKKARAIGREAGAHLTAETEGVRVINLADNAVDWVLAPEQHGRRVGWWRVEQEWYDHSVIYARVHGVGATLNLNVDGSPTERQIAPVAMPSAEWLADPQNGCVRPPHNPEKQQISVCTGRNLDGSKKYELFDLGSEPQEAASCQDTTPEAKTKTYCEKIDGKYVDKTIGADEPVPVHLPCTLGEVDEAQANMLIAQVNMGALTASMLPIGLLIFLVLLMVARRRRQHARQSVI